jgi:hypothetical protein
LKRLARTLAPPSSIFHPRPGQILRLLRFFAANQFFQVSGLKFQVSLFDMNATNPHTPFFSLSANRVGGEGRGEVAHVISSVFRFQVSGFRFIF